MSVDKNVIFKDFNLTPRAKKAYSDAKKIANDLGHTTINNFHVFYGCSKNMSQDLDLFLQKRDFDLNLDDIFDSLSSESYFLKDKFYQTKNSDPWHKEVVDSIKEANHIAQSLDQHYIGVEHIFYGVAKTSNYIFNSLISLNENMLCEALEKFVKGEVPEDEPTLEDLLSDFQFIENVEPDTAEQQEEEVEGEFPDFVTNLNKLYLDGSLADVYGRDDEMKILIETLSKKNKSNAVLTGEAGVGKTAVVEALAAKICNAEVPANLLGMEIFSVDIGNMLAGTQYRGQFEKKLKGLLKLAKENPFIILFFDEIHTIFGAGSNQEGGVDAANMLKPMLARGEIKCIGATTSKEYDKIFKKDSAMKRRFFNIEINEPSVKDTKEILYNCKKKYEEFHNVKFSKPIIDCIVELSDNTISNKKFPDKAFDIIDQVGARVKIKNMEPSSMLVDSHKDLVKFIAKEKHSDEEMKVKLKEFVCGLQDFHHKNKKKSIKIKKEDVLDVVAEHGKISPDQLKKSKEGFPTFLKRMKEEVFGQDEILDKVNDLLSCAKAGLVDEDKPLSSMFFVGPTSVGKTYTAKKIAKHYFGNEKAILQINMSELYDKTGISKLIGSNSGYIGYEEGGLLTNFVKENPNCVVLFDEIEKADPQILNILLHLLDEGYVEDNKHEKVDFSKCIVVFTSNIGHEKASKKSMGFVQDEETKEDSYKSSVRKRLKPELLARINQLFVFEDLSDNDFKRIINDELCKIKEKLSAKNIMVKFTSSTVSGILNKLKSENLHARDVKSFVREHVQVPVSKIVIKNSKIKEISVKSVDSKINVC